MPEEDRIENMLTTGDVARLLHISASTVRRWSDRGQLKAYRIGPGGARRFLRSAIAFLFQQRSPRGRYPFRT